MTEPPGSAQAVTVGCTCPRVLNEGGAGLVTDERGTRWFALSARCPLHGTGEWMRDD